MSSESESILKHNDKRTVRVERLARGDAAPPVVTKHFHDPNPLNFARDFFRARAEYVILRSLGRAGVAVPEAMRLHRRGRGWQIVMQWIPDAVELDDWLNAPDRQSLPKERVARALGRLLANIQSAGLDHGSLYADNVLLDRACRAWILDFHEAKLRPSLTGPQIRAQLVDVTGQLRELVAAPFRARAFFAWLRALDPRLRRSTGADRTWIGPIEARARNHRRAAVDHLLGRWLRRVARNAERRQTALVTLARDTSASEVEALFRAGRDGHQMWEDAEHGRFLVARGPAARLRSEWIELRRLWMHRLPVLEPVMLVEGRDSFSVYRLPGDAGMLSGPRAVRGGHAPALGRLIGLVHDRGWDASGVSCATLAMSESGAFYLAPGVECRPFDPIPDGSSQSGRFAGLGDLPIAVGPTGTGRAAFMSGYLSVFRTSVRHALAAALADEHSG